MMRGFFISNWRSTHDSLSSTMSGSDESSDSQWCLVGNIVQERLWGEGGKETRRGTQHFSPGSKVYCLPAQWGDGYQRVKVIGHHRGSRKFVTMIIPSKHITNWRAQVVYSPEVIRRLCMASGEDWILIWHSREQVEERAAMLTNGDDAGR